ncbi:MAG: GH3 auxin-responsive promoter family protein, partial [Rikenellaceae bacterium]
LEGVEIGVNYAMIISTLGGLWRYMIGDTVVFTSVTPYKIKITGRTKLFINAFGEEIIINNADRALAEACRVSGAEINEYTAAPVFMHCGEKGSHEWIIEFRREPDDMPLFCNTLDKTLQSINSDYEAKRFNDTTLHFPKIASVPTGTFFRWMESRGRLGGQNKVPRLSNDRKYVDELLTFLDA